MTSPDSLASQVHEVIAEAVRVSLVTTFFSEIQNAIRLPGTLQHENPITQKGCKYFSQNDEDGILLEVLRRMYGDNLNEKPKTFIEFGVGDGLENNTLILLMAGWKGFWAGGEDLVIDTSASRKLAFHKAWINRETCLSIYEGALARLGTKQVDVFSIDLDGTDLYVTEALMSRGARPSVVVCEYNGKFPPPIEFAVPYDPTFMWNGTDYFGASLQAYVTMMSRYDYELVACNITGLNAFFVQREYMKHFSDVPKEIAKIFVPANYGLITGRGHPISRDTITHFIQG